MIALLQRSVLTLSVLFCSAGPLAAQAKYYDMWFFGGRHSLDFRSNPVSPSSGSLEALEGCSSICDPNTGSILFYTNGASVWNRQHQVMPNGLNLNGNLSCTQSSLIVPHPTNSSLYYIFTLDGTTIGGPRRPQGLGLCYSIVDMAQDGGLGSVVTKNVTVLRTASEKLTAVRHRNGCGFWIITHELRNSKFYAWLLTGDGLSLQPVISSVGSSYDPTEAGNLKASPDGSLLFAARSFITYNGVSGELFRFDYGTGVVGPLVATIPSGYGASFSPDNNFLYASREDSLLQYDLRVAPGLIARSATLLNSPQSGRMFYGMQIASNGKVYTLEGPVFTAFNASAMKIGAVNSPNALGSAANYTEQFNYPSVNFFAGLPNCIDGYLGINNVGGATPTLHTVAGDTVICAGGNTQLRASGGQSYRWMPSEGLSCDTCANPVARPTETTTYLVAIYDDRSCKFFDTLQITVHVQDYQVNAGPDVVICKGSSTELRASGGQFYEWTPADDLSCTDCPAPTASPSATTTYYVKVTHQNGCVAVDSVKVTVNNQSPVRIGQPDTTLNCGESLTLTAPGGRDYLWSPAAEVSCRDCAEPVVTPKGTTTYYLDVVDSLGCVARDSITVRVSDVGIAAKGDTTFCVGGSAQLSVSGRRDYRWSPAAGLSCTDCPNPTATPAQTTTYVVEGSTKGTCFSYDTVVVTVLELPDADAGGAGRICLGDSLQLNGSGGTDYYWTPAVNISCLYCSDPVVFPSESITYYLQVTNEQGCSAWDSVRITVQSNSTVAAKGDTAFCAGGMASLSVQGAERYQWTPAAGLSCTDCANPTAAPQKTTVYYVVGTNAFGECPAFDSVLVTVYDFPSISITAEGDSAVCAGGAVQLRAAGGVAYRWDPSPELSCLDCADPTATPATTTTYYVTGTNPDGCESRDSVRVVVYPGLTVVAGEDRSICIEESTQLSASGGVRWLWEPSAGLSCTDCPNPIATPTATTVYRVTAWSAEGCTGGDSMEVAVRDIPEIIRLRIGRTYHGKTDEVIEVGVEAVEPIKPTTIGLLDFTLEYDPQVLLVDEQSIARLLGGTLLSGWNVAVLESRGGHLVVRLTAPAGTTLAGSGELLRFEGRVYLSGVAGTELPFTLSTASRCIAFESAPGYAEVDSICGLNFRLIELTAQKYVAPVVSPNPGRDRVRFEFGIGLDGPTRLEVFDALGQPVGLLVEDVLEPGGYTVEWNVQDVAAGVYWYRLNSGDWSEGGQVRVEH